MHLRIFARIEYLLRFILLPPYEIVGRAFPPRPDDPLKCAWTIRPVGIAGLSEE